MRTDRVAKTGTGEAGERGAALLIMVVSVLIAAALSFGLLAVSMGRAADTQSRLKMESALAMAEAGLCRGQAEANKAANKMNPLWPPVAGVSLHHRPDNTRPE